MIISKFNQQIEILETEFTKDVTLEEIVNYIISIKENKIYHRFLKIKTNATNSNFDFSINALKTIVIENDKLLEKYDFICDAIIADNPRTTAISMLYKKLAEKNDKYRFNVFSTDEGASDWLENY
jgi:tRNA A37 threonylcarbamoyltransferase TsaD